MKHINITLAILLFFTAPNHIFASDCPEVPAMPESEATAAESDSDRQQNVSQGLAPPYSAAYAAGNWNDVRLGVGYLRLVKAEDLSGASYYDWPMHVVAPFWRAPDAGAFGGWIVGGKIKSEGFEPVALSGAGMIETDYEHSSLIVHEKRADWLSVQLLPAQPQVWLHACHLASGEAKLRFEPWEAFIREHGDWLHFRAELAHNLRAAPDMESARIAVIGLDHKLALLEIRDDWMRVRVEQPDTTCSGNDHAAPVTRQTGWVKWRDEIKGPWVWTYTRGC